MSFSSTVLLHSHDSSNMALLVTANSCLPVPDGTSNLLEIRKPICCTPTDLCCCLVWIYSKSYFFPIGKPAAGMNGCCVGGENGGINRLCVCACLCLCFRSLQRASSLHIYLRSHLRGYRPSPWAILRPSFALFFSGPVVVSSHRGNVRHTHQAP